MDGNSTPVRFYGGASKQRVMYSATTPPSWGRNSQRRFPAVSGRSAPRLNSGSFGPGDVIDTSGGLNDMEELPLMGDDYAHGDYPADSGPTLQRLLEMMEKQTNRIDEIIKNQQELKTEQEALRQEISLKSSDEAIKIPRKKKVTRILTDRINTIHESFTTKLKPDESSTSSHNKSVMSSLVKEVKDDPENDFSESTITLGVKRKYEAERRLLKECEGGDDVKMKRVKKARYDRRKQRAYDRRKSVVTETEIQYFTQLSKEYMSDESDSSDSEVITIHKHSWRSQKFVAWMEELDKRYRSKLQNKKCSTPSKPRVVGAASLSLPPPNAPKWAVDADWSPPSTPGEIQPPDTENSDELGRNDAAVNTTVNVFDFDC